MQTEGGLRPARHPEREGHIGALFLGRHDLLLMRRAPGAVFHQKTFFDHHSTTFLPDRIDEIVGKMFELTSKLPT
jgi:hypothetical protein